MALSPTDIGNLWVKNGGTSDKNKMALAIAIALAESGGDPNAQNHNSNGTIDRGVWQINSIWGAQSTFDPDGNAKAAIAISKNGTNWQPWSTYGNGAYAKFKSQAAQGVLGVKTQGGAIQSGASAVGAAVSGAASATADIGKAIGFIFSLQFLYVIGGGILLIVALIMVASRATGGKVPVPPVIPV